VNEADFEEYVEEGAIDPDKLSTLLAPTAYGKTFMMHYGIQVTLKHPGIFS